MVTVDVWRDLFLLGRIPDSPVKTSLRSGGAERFLGRVVGAVSSALLGTDGTRGLLSQAQTGRS